LQGTSFIESYALWHLAAALASRNRPYRSHGSKVVSVFQPNPGARMLMNSSSARGRSARGWPADDWLRAYYWCPASLLQDRGLRPHHWGWKPRARMAWGEGRQKQRPLEL